MSNDIVKSALKHLLMRIKDHDVQLIMATDSCSFLTIFDCEQRNLWNISGYEQGFAQTYSAGLTEQEVVHALTALGNLDDIQFTLLTRTPTGRVDNYAS